MHLTERIIIEWENSSGKFNATKIDWNSKKNSTRRSIRKCQDRLRIFIYTILLKKKEKKNFLLCFLVIFYRIRFHSSQYFYIKILLLKLMLVRRLSFAPHLKLGMNSVLVCFPIFLPRSFSSSLRTIVVVSVSLFAFFI